MVARPSADVVLIRYDGYTYIIHILKGYCKKGNSSALAMELSLFCINPWIYPCLHEGLILTTLVNSLSSLPWNILNMNKYRLLFFLNSSCWKCLTRVNIEMSSAVRCISYSFLMCMQWTLEQLKHCMMDENDLFDTRSGWNWSHLVTR